MVKLFTHHHGGNTIDEDGSEDASPFGRCARIGPQIKVLDDDDFVSKLFETKIGMGFLVQGFK